MITEVNKMINKELKSKVMTLGNKMAPRMGGDRRAAFVQAWAIVKARAVDRPERWKSKPPVRPSGAAPRR